MSSTALATRTNEQYRAPKKGAKVRAVLAKVYPVKEGQKPEDPRISVAFDRETLEVLEFIAAVWNAMDKKMEINRDKWTKNGVIRRMVSTGLDEFWNQAGRKPESFNDPEAFAVESVAHIERAAKAEEAAAAKKKK